MVQRFLIKPRLAALMVAVALGTGIPTAFAAPADDLKDAQRLYGQGKLAPAMEKVDAFLKVQPRDPQGRFLKGLVLTEQKRVPEAIQVFTGLTEDFPELPEPYNNLAVLYASQGNYDKAKSALELAIHTHPSYATAHENLGDIYAQLASRAYDRALSLDKNNTTAQVKLSMVKDLFSPPKLAPPKGDVTSKAEPPKDDAAKADSAKDEPAKVDTAKAEAPKAEPAAAPGAKASPAATKEPAKDHATGDFAVQVFAFSDDKGANSLVNKLKGKGFPAYSEPVNTSRGTLWRVRVGPYVSRETAGAARDKLKVEGYNGIVAAAK